VCFKFEDELGVPEVGCRFRETTNPSPDSCGWDIALCFLESFAISGYLSGSSQSAFALRARRVMMFFCRHCDELAVGEPYRVISEEDGVILLNMTVCRSCCEQAKALGLHSEPIPRSKTSRSRDGWRDVSTVTAATR